MAGILLMIGGALSLAMGAMMYFSPKTITPISITTSPPPLIQPKPEMFDGMTAIELAALKAINFSSYTRRDVTYNKVTQEMLDEERLNVAALRAWVATLDDGDIKAAYTRWADHFERSIDECEDEMKTGTQKKIEVNRRAKIDAAFAAIPHPP